MLKSTLCSHKAKGERKNCTLLQEMHGILFWSTFILSYSRGLSSPLISSPLSPRSCQCPCTKQRGLYLFLQQWCSWSLDLWLCSGPHLLSQFHCLVPAVIEVQGSLMCCQPLISPVQSNPDERVVVKWVHSLSYDSLGIFYNLTAHLNALVIPLSMCILLWTQFIFKKYKEKREQERAIMRKTKMSSTFLAVKEVRPSLKQR